jgi:hypothetical protein
MLRRARVHVTYANVVATVALVLALGAGGWAVAAVTATDGTVNGCYSTKSSVLRAVDSKAKCPSGTKPVRLAGGGTVPLTAEVDRDMTLVHGRGAVKAEIDNTNIDYAVKVTFNRNVDSCIAQVTRLSGPGAGGEPDLTARTEGNAVYVIPSPEQAAPGLMIAVFC